MKLYETYEVSGIGYEKLFNFKSWRLAKLNYIDELNISHLNFIECHLNTDEVFILLDGQCDMFLLDNKNPKTFDHFKLEINKVYRIPKNVYHAHALSKEAKVLIIEEDDTSDANSDRIYLTEEEMAQIRKIYLGENK